MAELNRAAAKVAREAAEEADRPVLVGGSIGPTGELMVPLGALTADEAVGIFTEQAQALAEGGVDVLWIETMSAPEEVEAAVKGAATTGLPIVSTMSFDTNGRTMMGLTPEAPSHSSPACRGGPWPTAPTAASARRSSWRRCSASATPPRPTTSSSPRATAASPSIRDGHIHYSGTPDVMATYAHLARNAGARIIGGCCGTQPVHLQAMRAALDEAAGPVPDLEMVAATLGPITAPVVQQGEPAQRRRRARA